MAQLPIARTVLLTCRIVRFSLLASGLVFLAGCGGGSKGRSRNPSTVGFTFSSGTPTIVAAKFGSGPFAVEALAGNSLSLSIPSGTSTFAVAYVCTNTSFPTFQEVFEASIADGSSFTLPCLEPLSPGPTGAFTGNVDASAFPNANLLQIAAYNGSAGFIGTITADADFSLTPPAGNDRVEILAYDNVTRGAISTPTMVAARNFIGQTVPGTLNGGSQVVLGAGDAATTRTVSYSNFPTGYSAPSTQVDFLIGGRSRFPVSTTSTQYPLLPTDAVVSGDFYEFVSSAMKSAKPSETMVVSRSVADPGAVSFAFPAPWSYAGPSPAVLPSFNFSYAGFNGKTGVFNSVFLLWENSSIVDQYILVTSSNYLQGITTVAFPDLSKIAGFMAPPPSGTPIVWASSITQSSLGVSQPLQSNATITTVGNSGNYTVP